MSAFVVAAFALLSGGALEGPYDKAAEISRSSSGISMLVMEAGKIVFEEYPNGGSADKASELASGTKSFSGVLALCALRDGLLKLDEKVSETLTEWRSDGRRAITIRQLLSLSSGMPSGTLGRVPSYADAILQKSVAAPDSRFIYGPVPFQCFGELLRRKLLPQKLTVGEYLEKNILKPAGVKCDRWRRDENDNIHLPSGAFLTAREWAKFGEWIRLDTQGALAKKDLADLFRSSPARPGYGLTWWLPSKGPVGVSLLKQSATSKKIPVDIWEAAGAGGQRLYVIPSRELVVVRQAPVRLRDDFSDPAFLSALLGG